MMMRRRMSWAALCVIVALAPVSVSCSRRTAHLLAQPSPLIALTSAPAAGAALSEARIDVDVSAKSDSGGNPVFQMVGYVKDSVVRMVDGVGLMWQNYGRCNEIRAKQKHNRDTLRIKWEDGGMSRSEVKKRLKSVNGGITYDEYAFLIKGREDRAKLTQLGFLSFGAPRFLPYALMFYPEMLPSAFAPQDKSSGAETKMQALSRERSHAVIRTLLKMERDARVVPALAKLNIFGRKGQQQAMEKMEHIGHALASDILKAPVRDGAEGANLVLDTLSGQIFSETELDAKSKRLVAIPKTIIKGLAQTIEGSSPLDSFLPTFVTRGKVLNHIKKVAESDEFLVAEAVDLADLGTQRLEEACKDRLIGRLGKSNVEMREILGQWLDQSVVQPSVRIQDSGEHYNGNLARAALMGYHALQAAKDHHSASYLPRFLFSAQSGEKPASPSSKHKSKKSK